MGCVHIVGFSCCCRARATLADPEAAGVCRRAGESESDSGARYEREGNYTLSPLSHTAAAEHTATTTLGTNMTADALSI